MNKFWLMMTIFTVSQWAYAEAFPKEDEEWQIRRPNTPSWNQEDDLPAARGRKAPAKDGPTNQELEEVERADQPSSSIAEEPRPQPPVQNEPREVSSYEEPAATREESANDQAPVPHDRGFRLRLGLIGGVSNLKSGDATSQSQRVEQALTQNFFLGGVIDSRFGRYVQAEIEGFYGLAPNIELTDSQGANAQMKKLQQHGVFAAGILRLPIGGFVPKFGAGFGLVGVGQRLVVGNIETQTSEQAAGPFVMGGADFEISPVVTLSGDYSHSVSGRGSYASATTGITPTDESSNAIFDRIRVAGYYRFSRRVIAGAMFHIVNLSTALKPHNTTAPTGSEAMSQFMFVGMTEF